jgi:hypothetical protein
LVVGEGRNVRQVSSADVIRSQGAIDIRLTSAAQRRQPHCQQTSPRVAANTTNQA